MSAIECAFFGSLGRDAEAKVFKMSGKDYARLNVRVGDGDDVQWINVTSFDPSAIETVDRLVKGARVYVEGSLRLDEQMRTGGSPSTFDKWTAQDGTERHGLSCVSWHTRLAAIGRNKPKRDGDRASVNPRTSRSLHDDLSNAIPL